MKLIISKHGSYEGYQSDPKPTKKPLRKCKENAETGAFLTLLKQKKVENLKKSGIITKAIRRDEKLEKVIFG